MVCLKISQISVSIYDIRAWSVLDDNAQKEIIKSSCLLMVY